jgi:dihydroxyacetone kinase
MNACDLREGMRAVSRLMKEKRGELIEIDALYGDGDLGISMDNGFGAVTKYLDGDEGNDLGKLLMGCGSAFNDSAPSSLGTILSFGMMGMAKALKGKTDADLSDIAEAMEQGLHLITQKTNSKTGERTILDALEPAVKSLKALSGSAWETAFNSAAEAAADGAERTKQMPPVHGRAAFYGEKTLGHADGGAVACKYIFEALSRFIQNKSAN